MLRLPLWVGLGVVCVVMGSGGTAWALTNYQLAEEITRQGTKSVKPLMREEKSPEKNGLFLLLSLSLPKQEFRGYVLEARKLGARVALRGFVGNSFRKHVTFIRKILDIPDVRTKKVDTTFLASIVIDPTLFRMAAIEQVPAWVYRSGAEMVVVRGSGTGETLLKTLVGIDPRFQPYRDWYDTRSGSWARSRGSEKVARPALPELSISRTVKYEGQRWSILEPDLLKALKDRAKTIDMTHLREVMNKKATAMIEKGPGLNLPVAKESKVHLYDPTVVFTEPVINPVDGQEFAPAGTKVNPLEHVSWHYEYAVFDPKDSRQIKVIEDWLVAKKAHEVKLLITRGNVLKWAKKFELPVFWAQPEVVAGLRVNVVPSLVSQKGNRIQVEEIHP